MLTVHHLENSRSQRVLWLLEELGLAYDIKRYKRDPQTLLAPPELRRVHPLGKAPVLVDDGHAIAESGAIIDHVLERHGRGRLTPARGSEAHHRFRYFMHYAEGSLMPPLLMTLVFERMPKAKMPGLLRPLVRRVAERTRAGYVDPQLSLHLDFLETELASRPWFAGTDFSAADIQMSFPLEAADARIGLGPGRPRLTGFLERIHARPAYQRALDRGGPYALLR